MFCSSLRHTVLNQNVDDRCFLAIRTDRLIAAMIVENSGFARTIDVQLLDEIRPGSAIACVALLYIYMCAMFSYDDTYTFLFVV